MYPTQHAFWMEPVQISDREHKRRQNKMRDLHKTQELEDAKYWLWGALTVILLLMDIAKLLEHLIAHNLLYWIVFLHEILAFVCMILVFAIYREDIYMYFLSIWTLKFGSKNREYQYSIEKIQELEEATENLKRDQAVFKTVCVLLAILQGLLFFDVSRKWLSI